MGSVPEWINSSLSGLDLITLCQQWARTHTWSCKTFHERGGIGRWFHSFSKLWLLNFKVRQFSETMRTTLSGTPPGTRAWISTVTEISLFGRLARCWMISLAIVPTSRLIRAASTFTLPKKCVGGAAGVG